MSVEDNGGIFRPWKVTDTVSNPSNTFQDKIASSSQQLGVERKDPTQLACVSPVTSPRGTVAPLHPVMFASLLRQMHLQSLYYTAQARNALAINAMTSHNRMSAMTQAADVTRRKTDEAETIKTSDVINEQPIDLTVRSNAHAPPKLTSSLPLPLPSDGEPLDLLPKSMYLHQSQGGGHLCVFCGKVYSRKYGLKIHLRTHTGYKPLKCKVCARQFGDPSNLNKHIRLHAEGATPYRCPHCGKVLVRKRDLDRHIRSRHPETMTANQTEAAARKTFQTRSKFVSKIANDF